MRSTGLARREGGLEVKVHGGSEQQNVQEDRVRRIRRRRDEKGNRADRKVKEIGRQTVHAHIRRLCPRLEGCPERVRRLPVSSVFFFLGGYEADCGQGGDFVERAADEAAYKGFFEDLVAGPAFCHCCVSSLACGRVSSEAWAEDRRVAPNRIAAEI